MVDPALVRKYGYGDGVARGRGRARVTPEARAALMELIEGDDLLDALDATGDTIHGYDFA